MRDMTGVTCQRLDLGQARQVDKFSQASAPGQVVTYETGPAPARAQAGAPGAASKVRAKLLTKLR